MNNYFTTFHLLPTLKLATIEQQVCWTKTGCANALSLGTKNRKKKSSANLTEVGLKDNRALCIAFSKFSKTKRFAWSLSKVEGKYIQEQQST